MARPTRHNDKWRIRWSDAAGKRRSELYDSFKEASLALQRHQLEEEEIKRGLRAPIAHRVTFDALCDYWVDKRAPQKKSYKDDISIIRRHLRPLLGKLQLNSLSIAHIDDLIVSKRHLSSKTVSNILTLLTTMVNVAFDLGWIARVPRIRKPRTPHFTSDYRYLRTKDEIDRFLRAAREEGEHVFTLYAAAVYTGLRAGELAGLRWDDIDLSRRLITVQRSFSSTTKSGDVRYVPILDPLLPVLRAWRLLHPGELVFTNRDGNMLGPSGRIFQEVLHRVLEGAQFPKVLRKGERVRYITFHSLRHTFASHWVMNGGDLFKLQKILGHKTVQMTMRYAHLTPHAYADDYARLGSSAPAGEGEVIQLR